MELFNGQSQTLMPGQRLIRIKGGYDTVEKYPMPRDCEASFFDEEEDYCYIKKTDTNGGALVLRYLMTEEPIPKFDPKKYVTIDDFNSFKEEMLNGFNTLQQTLTANIGNNSKWQQPAGGRDSKQSNKSNNDIG